VEGKWEGMGSRNTSGKNLDRFTVKQAWKGCTPRGARGHASPGNFFNSNYLAF